jgi:plasmid stability protein
VGILVGGALVPSLFVRRIDHDMYAGLKARAARHGVSMEEEVRRILYRAVAAPDNLMDLALEYFGKAHGVELELLPREPHTPLDFR